MATNSTTDSSAYKAAYEEFQAARTAYLNALKSAQSASVTSGVGSKSYTSFALADLKRAMNDAKEKCWEIAGGVDAAAPKIVRVRFH